MLTNDLNPQSYTVVVCASMAYYAGVIFNF